MFLLLIKHERQRRARDAHRLERRTPRVTDRAIVVHVDPRDGRIVRQRSGQRLRARVANAIAVQVDVGDDCRRGRMVRCRD